jgi:amino acid adenylation domain-containing protein
MKNDKYSLKTAAIASQNIKEREYWLDKLSGQLHKSTFPYTYNFRKSSLKEFSLDSVKFQVTGGMFSKLMRLSNNSDTRLYIVLLSGVILLINKYTGDEDIIVGTSICKQPGDVDLINTVLALRNKLKDNMTLKDLLMQVRQTYMEAADNQDYPYEALLYNLNLPVSENDSPLFEIAVLLENIHGRKYIQHTNPRIIFSFFRTEEAIEGTLGYHASQYERVSINKMVTHYLHMLRTGLLNVDLPISQLDVLPEEERRELIAEFNFNDGGPRTEIADVKVIHQLFAKQVRNRPDRIAAIHKDEKLTYKGLNEKSNRVAAVLRQTHVCPNDIVALIMAPSTDMIAVILGVLKAGGAYLPIDPDSPPDRIKYMLADSSARVLISHKGLALDLCFRGDWLDIDSLNPDEDGFTDPEIINSSRDLAYVIYTSGSTGKPKGIMTQHGNVIAYTDAFYRKVEITADTIMLQQASYTFDVFVEEVFPVLLRGGRIVIPDHFEIIDARLLSRFIIGHNINTVDCSPLLLNELNILNNIEGVHTFISGGDVLKKEYIDNFLGRARVYNSYGPTESTICVTYHECSPEDPPTIPIGKPLANYKTYILDRHSKLLPPGVPGELCVSGAGVSRGYLNCPLLTREIFVDNPLVPGESLYKTGDLARWRFDRNIEFLGRIDHQVKIRGYRIELGEIENQLLKVNGLKEVVVTAKGEEDLEKYLCAYIVSEQKIDIAALRKSLVKELPDYMIPTYFVPLESIPLTERGKIDRKALPDPNVNIGEDFVAPGDEVEKELAAIWSEVLGIEYEKVSINDNFFLSGGHSLKATLLVTRIHKAFDVKVPFSVVFKTPTIKELGVYIKIEKRYSYTAIEPTALKEYYALSPAQKRIYILQQMDEGNISYNGPEMAVLEGNLDKAKIEDVFRKLIKRHESLRTSIILVDDEPFQKIYNDVDFEMEYVETVPEDAQKFLNSFVRPFDLSRAPLFRVRLVKVGEIRHILMVDIHHMISDGTSQEIFISDFLDFYAGEGPTPLRIQYKDYSEWRNSRGEAEIEREKKQEEFWLKQFQDGVPVMNLPTDYVRPALRSFGGNIKRFAISREETDALNALTREEETTLFIVMVTLFNVFLSRLSGQEDIVIGTPVAGRNHADLETTIGMYVNTLALRNYPSGTKTFKEFILEVKERALQAFDNQDYQFEDLVDKIVKKRNPNRSTVFDVMFALQNMDTWNGEIPGLKVIPNHEYKFESFNISKFDLAYAADVVDGCLSFYLEYSTDLFKPETIDLYNDYLKQIISAVLMNKNIKLKDIHISDDLFDQKIEINQMEFGF